MFLLAVNILALLGAMLLSTVATWTIRGLARKRNWARGPESDRHVHKAPIPRLGGVAVYFTFCALILFETAVVSFGLHLHRPESTRIVLRILMPATLMFVVGLVDDIFNIRAVLKLAAEIIAGVWLYRIGCHVPMSGIKFHGVDYSHLASCLATIAWVVMLSNAFNLIDGLDGLAAGASVFPLLTFSAVALHNHNGQMAVASLVLTGALLGFLRFNFNPATIFLGDSGSLFIGFMLSALSLAGNQAKAPTLLSVALPVVACGLPLAETMVSIMRRFLSGRPIFTADREHFHHRLLTLGFSHRQVVILLFAVSGICSLLSVVLLFPKPEVIIMVALAVSMLITVGVGKLGYPEFAEIGRLVLRVSQQKAVIAQNVKLRQVATALSQLNAWEEVAHALRAGFSGGPFAALRLTVRSEATFRKADEPLSFDRVISLHPQRSRSCWSIKLEFEGGYQKGSLELVSPYREQSLMLDVNVLLHVLTPALSRSCKHISARDQIVVMHEAQRSSARSATVRG
jgi:UDP-GlcNAc:undecaprenyl-phosphate/decaprenyl-phosphate GlcNAc-1-phosphate transferase